MWAIQYGRGHIDVLRFKTRRAAILSWVRSCEPDLAKADDAFVLRHWTSIRRLTNCKTVRVD